MWLIVCSRLICIDIHSHGPREMSLGRRAAFLNLTSSTRCPPDPLNDLKISR